jgi:hypothetical protein
LVNRDKYNLLIELFDEMLKRKNNEIFVRDYEIAKLKEKIKSIETKG